MAKPDTDDGWLKYAHELDAALACADWSKGARIVLREVFAQIFGPAKRRIAQVSPSELARRHETEKSNIVRSVRELVTGGALTRVSEGWYRFNKNYEAWTRNGHSRLSKGEIKAVRSAPDIAMSYKNIAGDKSDTEAETNLTPSETSLTPGGVSNLSPNGDKSDTVLVSNLSPVPLIEDSRTLGFKTGDLRQIQEQERASEVASPLNSPDAVAKLAARTEARWPAQNADCVVGDLCRDFDYRLVTEILDQAFAKDPKKLPIGWVRKGCQNQFAANWKPKPSVNGNRPVVGMSDAEYDKLKKYKREQEALMQKQLEYSRAQKGLAPPPTPVIPVAQIASPKSLSRNDQLEALERMKREDGTK